MVLEGSGSVLREVLSKVHSVVFSSEAIYAVEIFMLVLLLAAHVIWILERRDNPQFPRSYPQGISAEMLENVDQAYRRLQAGKVDAVVYDAPVLQHYAAAKGRGRVRVVGLVFQEKSYGMALGFRSPHRDRVNIALLRLMEEGVYQQLKDKWFGMQ